MYFYVLRYRIIQDTKELWDQDQMEPNTWRAGIYGWEMFNIVGLSGIKKQDDEGYQTDNVFKLTNNGSDMH